MTTDDKIYAGAKGVKVLLYTEQDLSLSTKTEILVKKPNGTEVTWTATIATEREDETTHETITLTPEDGYIQYITDEDDLESAGDYLLQAKIEWGQYSSHPGKTVIMEVYPKFK